MSFPRLDPFPSSKNALIELQKLTGKSYGRLLDEAVTNLLIEVKNNKMNREVGYATQESKISR
jgi:hypothetical protein